MEADAERTAQIILINKWMRWLLLQSEKVDVFNDLRVYVLIKLACDGSMFRHEVLLHGWRKKLDV